MRAPRKATLALALFVCNVGTAIADNAALSTGGAPKMMDSHPSVVMESEVVTLTVHWDRVDTDCQFIFANTGAACKVNMGFPDFGLWAYNYPHDKPISQFKKYQSYVDGKSVPTKLVLDANKRQQWQTKTVAFPAKGKRVVREVYSTKLEGAALEVLMGAASYLLHTGASWKDGIGKATVIVTLAPDLKISAPLNMSYGQLQKMKAEQLVAHLNKPGAIIVNGPCKPIIKGSTITFVRNNWKPTEADDILVGFKLTGTVVQKMKDALKIKPKGKTP